MQSSRNEDGDVIVRLMVSVRSRYLSLVLLDELPQSVLTERRLRRLGRRWLGRCRSTRRNVAQAIPELVRSYGVVGAHTHARLG
jgi:hypothetical protein